MEAAESLLHLVEYEPTKDQAMQVTIHQVDASQQTSVKLTDNASVQVTTLTPTPDVPIHKQGVALIQGNNKLTQTCTGLSS